MRLSSRVTGLLREISVFSRLPDEEIADRMTVIILLFLIAVGFLLIPRVANFAINSRWSSGISIATLLLLITTISWRWGDPTFDQFNEVLWYGWGDKFAILVLFGGVFLTVLTSLNLPLLRRVLSTGTMRAINLVALIMLVVYYLPSVIQPFKGIIDTYHSRYLLNDLLIFSSGRMPFTDITPQYVGVLGWPIKLLTFLPGEFVVNSSLVWVNALVVIEVLLIAILTKKAIAIQFWAVAFILPVATMFVKVQPNMRSWGSLASHVNLIPGRTVLPILLLFIVSAISVSEKIKSRHNLIFTLGFLSVLTAFNNIEFGAPAAIAALIVLVGLRSSVNIGIKSPYIYVGGLVSGFLLVFAFYALNDSRLTLKTWSVMIRAHGVDGFMNLAMPFFGLWIFFYAILGASAVIGANKLFRDYKTQKPSDGEIRSSILLTFGGLWGSATLFYFSGRSLVPEIVVFLIPLTLCIIGFLGLVKSYLQRSITGFESAPRSFNILWVPLFSLLLIPIISISQAPNPGYEWLRMAGTGERWSSRALKELPKYKEMIEIVNNDPTNSYIYMGNDGPAFEIMSGVKNGLGIILLQDLLINQDLTDVGCTPALNSGADFALVSKFDWVNPPNKTPCAGFELLLIDPESEFLIYKIPSKVSS